MAYKHGITVLNTPGTIDSDYRGEVKVLLYNAYKVAFTVKVGARIAQMVFAVCERPTMRVVRELPLTQRGDGGFGHTGGM
jgi:dUTP pyrophosphatase